MFPNYESLISLAAAAAVTERIRLVTDILLAPLRANTALFAKQAATLDSLSEGRLELGLASGAREDDYEVSGVDFGQRGKIFDRQLEELPRLWKGEGGVGPPPARERPGLLIGGTSERAFKRAARHADGWTQGGGTPDAFKEGREKAGARGRPPAGTGARRPWPSSTSRSATGPRSTPARTWATTTPGSGTSPSRSSPAPRPTPTP